MHKMFLLYGKIFWCQKACVLKSRVQFTVKLLGCESFFNGFIFLKLKTRLILKFKFCLCEIMLKNFELKFGN